MRKTPLSIRKIDLSAFHGAKPSIHYTPRGTWNSAPIFYLSLIARIYQYALTLLILLQEAQLNHTTGLA